MIERGVITGITVAHTRATVDEIETAGDESVRAVVSDLLAHDGVEEAFGLQTCNRAEAYVVTERVTDGIQALGAFAPDTREGATRHLDHEESLRHLMRVAAGLESMVLGEDQILGQLRQAYEEARGAGGIGPVLEDTVSKAIHVGERTRTETAVNEGVISVGSAAVQLAAEETSLDGATALVVGAGEMGTLVARALDDTPVSAVYVANRTIPHAEHLTAELDTDARAIPLADVAEVLPAIDLVLTATDSPEPLIDRDDLVETGPVVCVDIAQPRDIDPGARTIPDVRLFDIDALESVTERTRDRREAEAREVEALIDEEFERLLESFKRKRADEAIAAMYESADRVKARELETALSKLESQGEFTAEQRETVDALADALVGQLLAAPTKSLREAASEDDWTTIQTALHLFDPEFDVPPASPGGGAGTGAGAGAGNSAGTRTGPGPGASAGEEEIAHEGEPPHGPRSGAGTDAGGDADAT